MMRILNIFLFLILLINNSCTNSIRPRTFWIYEELNLILYFDQQDSLDGFVMYSDQQDSSRRLHNNVFSSKALVPHVGVLGIVFGDSAHHVLEILGDPTTKIKPDFHGDIGKQEVYVWQNKDTTLLIAFNCDTVVMFTDYLYPVDLPYGVEWRDHKNTVKQHIGEPTITGKGLSKHSKF